MQEVARYDKKRIKTKITNANETKRNKCETVKGYKWDEKKA